MLCNGLVLASFAMIAMASSSSKDVYDGVDGFVEGWQYGKSLTSDASEEIHSNALDSITAVEQPLVANN